MYRTHTCGELRLSHLGQEVTLAGWVQRLRKMGGMTFVDLRDRYGITQLVFDQGLQADLAEQANHLGREYVIQVQGVVRERESKNAKIATGDIEMVVNKLTLLNESALPPFTIEDKTDGGDDLRMQYRYLDLRRPCVRQNLELRHKLAFETRRYLDSQNFLEIETPFLIKSTPEGARDFVVPSRMNPGQFYALPQSPQQFKQLLMVAGFDRYFQIVKCFRDEDLRADRQPEFTQIDCEMSYADQEDVIQMFEGLMKHLFKTLKNIEFEGDFPRMTWEDAMKYYGSDKPDIRFGMKFVELKDLLPEGNFQVFDNAPYVGGICVPGCASYSRKQIDQLTDFVKRSQIGAQGLIWIKKDEQGQIKSSIDKFYTPEVIAALVERFGAANGDLMLIMCGQMRKTQKQLCALRLEVAEQLGLRNPSVYAPLWVVDFPLFEWDEETQRFYATHHPFTMPNPEDIPLLDSDQGKVRSWAYDCVINGVELGGGSVRIHDSELQARMFKLLGFTEEKALAQFGCIINAFKYGAPPHAGLAFGLDRIVSMFAELDSIRDCIAFPKNNAGRDVMIDAPSNIDDAQLEELCLTIQLPESK
ncbi:MAG: aspartate--tRNA ligase [Bacteroidales bacterium]|nr:aspartate--tRNA ligase [Bacteroidales bacterium]MBQ5604025.1 aspartate--tRNA ligase [Bacteroidales bacterium]MBR0333954.1 aspartate--tRNA ligase [Bacteroidales bacterium]MBR0453843.1 aspartate--tRNA ligase [Bacteroidales bacterium]